MGEDDPSKVAVAPVTVSSPVPAKVSVPSELMLTALIVGDAEEPPVLLPVVVWLATQALLLHVCAFAQSLSTVHCAVVHLPDTQNIPLAHCVVVAQAPTCGLEQPAAKNNPINK
jgi:hypothetical protein